MKVLAVFVLVGLTAFLAWQVALLVKDVKTLAIKPLKQRKTCDSTSNVVDSKKEK